MPNLRMHKFVLASALMLTLCRDLYATQLRSITVQDCVRTRRIVDQEVQISPEGSYVAYVVKTADLSRNRNDYRLYVRNLTQVKARENGRLLLQADFISSIRWIGRRELVANVGVKKRQSAELHNRVTIVNLDNHSHRLNLPFDFQLYSSSADGNTMAFSVEHQTKLSNDIEQTRKDNAQGYRVSFGSGTEMSYEQLPAFDIYLGENMRTSRPAFRKLCLDSNGSSPCLPLRNIVGLNLSPDGKRLLITYSARTPPRNWGGEPIVDMASGAGTLFDTYVLGVYAINTGEMRLAFNYIGTLLHARWMADSRHFAVVGPSPFGTKDSVIEAEKASASGEIFYYMDRFQHVFVVDARNGAVKKLINREGNEPGTFKLWGDFPIWNHGNEGLVRAGPRELAWVEQLQGVWHTRSCLSLPNELDYVSFLTGDSKKVIGVSQTTTNPPNLFLFNLRSKKAVLLTDLNPKYREIQMGSVERLEWTNEYGSRCTGLLIKPVGFQVGKRYPMVFLAAYPSDDFISDAPYATTAYAPQSLANAGFLVVVAHYPADNKVPKGKYPGEMSFAYNWMSMVESVVDLLAARNIIDPEAVGIGGFSRTSWLTDFVLTHSTRKFVAASSADSGLYNYWTYFRSNSRQDMKSDETQLGGPPYGETFLDWLKYAAPFNANKVNAAVLMEYIGTAEHGFEFFVALSRLGKAVEFYRYPMGQHPLDTPWERVASLQRNVDWFRFWLQGYERPNPEDPQQYPRWRAMRTRTDAAKANLRLDSNAAQDREGQTNLALP
jgi:dipeptidyl aminopeptidase/acylaminoacyl peptidase